MNSSPDVAHLAQAGWRGAPRKKKHDYGRLAFQLLFLLPAVAFLVIFMFYPIEETFRMSLMQTSGVGEATYIGLENYRALIFGVHSEEFRAGFVHVLVWAVWSVVIQIPLAFFIAFSLVAYKNRFTGVLRVIYYMSSIIPSTIVAMLGRFIFAPKFGVIATLSKVLGWTWLGRVDFLGDPSNVFWSLFAVATWAYIGFGIVYLMANIEQISADIREAAELDGANRFQYAIYVVAPMVSYPIRILAIINTVGCLKLFDIVYLMTQGGPRYSSTTLAVVLYKQGFVNWHYGLAAAIGVVIFLMSLFFSVAQFSLQRRGGDIE